MIQERSLPRAHKCPTCGKPVEPRKPQDPTPPEYPFCSARCKQIDLGRWFLGNYAISSKMQPEQEEIEPIEDERSEDEQSA
ncbi:MAG TPA: DNA gyrase inhibitor YacG [bacterium]|nr:DNA gyrase inhibitor YacG [bacterium]